jgi:hypothetical protein
VTLPPTAFVDKNGETIKGDVKVNYREFHNSAEIMVSGIPMNFKNEDGTYENFESAGMFEITADHGGEEVKLAKGKQITCETVTHETDENYNFYHFDGEGKQWQEVEGQNKSVQKPEDRMEDSEQIGEAPTSYSTIAIMESEPKKPRKADLNLPVFEIGSPESPTKKKARKKSKAIGTASESLLWQFAPGYDISESAMKQVLSGSNWDDYELEMIDPNENIYRLDLGKAKNNPIHITPVLLGKDYRKAMASYTQQLEAFNKRAKDIAKEREYAERRNILYRTAKVSGLGIFNWDRIKKRKTAVQLQASFELEDGSALPEGAQVFMLTGRKKDIITYYPAMFANFAYEPLKRNYLISVLPGDQIAVFTRESFKALDIRKIKQKRTHKFTLKTVAASIVSVSDLQEFIDAL